MGGKRSFPFPFLGLFLLLFESLPCGVRGVHCCQKERKEEGQKGGGESIAGKAIFSPPSQNPLILPPFQQQVLWLCKHSFLFLLLKSKPTNPHTTLKGSILRWLHQQDNQTDWKQTKLPPPPLSPSPPLSSYFLPSEGHRLLSHWKGNK